MFLKLVFCNWFRAQEGAIALPEDQAFVVGVVDSDQTLKIAGDIEIT